MMIYHVHLATPGTIPTTASSPTTTRTENKAEKGVRSSIKKPSTKPLHKIATPGTIPTASSPTTTRTENKAEKGVRSSIKKPSTKPLHKIATPGTIPTASSPTTTRTENKAEKGVRSSIKKPSTKPLHKIATHETTTGTENMTEKRTRWPIESTTLHIKAAKGVSPTPRKMTMLPKTKPSGLEDICKTRPKDEFHLPYPPDPSKFVQCDITGRAYLRSCGDLTVWDNTFKACVGKQMF
ncbi:salivary glue protein Sgs-3-like isoform X2 [Pecten maximus]|uniref:salivary glue protein Sgs-3-like isoform X2 n=1 Tax=Pecten maximus TaxID=6579 RepID=UPI001458F27F|nr:salivary glue protein Sgs-3-like isoform X2 [Pecten maximus]